MASEGVGMLLGRVFFIMWRLFRVLDVSRFKFSELTRMVLPLSCGPLLAAMVEIVPADGRRVSVVEALSTPCLLR